MKTNFQKNLRRGFSLIEVMIACIIFFSAVFVILELISNGLNNARRLQRPLVDASALLSQLSLTNKLTEGIYSGNLGDMLGKQYDDYKWTCEISEVSSNKLFRADYVIQRDNGDREIISQMSSLFYRPDSAAGSMDGGTFVR